MLIPTEDKELQQELAEILRKICKSDVCIDDAKYDISQIFERRGYHIGLPSNIEHALNSGDGSYHP